MMRRKALRPLRVMGLIGLMGLMGLIGIMGLMGCGKATPEELEREESDPHYTISYGIDEERTEINSDVCFEMNGVKYLLLTSDDVSEDELFAMAEEIISSVK